MSELNKEVSTSNLFDLDIVSSSFDEFVSFLNNLVDGIDKNVTVFTPNVDHIVKLYRDELLKSHYSKADYFIPDGMPIVWVSRILGDRINERIAGSDLFCRINKESGYSRKIFIIGGPPGEESNILSHLANKYPHHIYAVDSPPFSNNIQDIFNVRLREKIVDFSPEIIFVCLGFPKQEYLALKLKEVEIINSLIMCVGAAIDFEMGNSKRAPVLLQKAGFEWLWRLLNNPVRLFRRYMIEDFKFFFYVFLEIMKIKK